MWSFDTVSIDSDLDSVRTEQVRQHLQRCSGEGPQETTRFHIKKLDRELKTKKWFDPLSVDTK